MTDIFTEWMTLATPLCKLALSHVIFRYYPVLRDTGAVNQIYCRFILTLKFYQCDFFLYNCPVEYHPLLNVECDWDAIYVLDTKNSFLFCHKEYNLEFTHTSYFITDLRFQFVKL